MLPMGHIGLTCAGLNLLQRKAGAFADADYRLVALAAVAPDLLDKPLALTLYRDANAALFWGHNLWLHLAVWMLAWAGTRRAPRPFSRVLPYLLAFSGHLIADRMWGFRETLFYPLGAGYWHPWVHVGAPGAMLAAYLDIIATTPLLIAFELSGAAALAWLIRDRSLWRSDSLGALVRTGRVAPAGNARADRRPESHADPAAPSAGAGPCSATGGQGKVSLLRSLAARLGL